MNGIPALVVILLFSCTLHAQYSIRGKVADKNQGGIPSTLFLNELRKQVGTDSSGTFEINDLPKGIYTLECRSPGYHTSLHTITIPYEEPVLDYYAKRAAKAYEERHPAMISLTQQGNVLSLNVILEKRNVEISEVVVTGTRNTLQEKSVQSIEVLNAEGILERGQLTVMEALAARPGVSLISTGPGIARPVIRGLTGNRIVTVTNGVRLENQQWDLEHTLGMTQYGIDRVEILKGPASFLYGSDAMGGVLNFVDEKPAAVGTRTGDVSASFNSNTFGTTTGAGIKGASETKSWIIRAGFNNHSDYYAEDFASTDRVANSRFREVFGKASIALSGKRSVTLLSWQFNLGYYGIVEPFEALDTTKTKEEEDHPQEFETPYHTMIHNALLVKNTNRINGRTRIVTTLAYQNDLRAELEPGNSEDNPFLGFNLNVVSLDVKGEHDLSDKINLVVGAQGGYQNNANDGYGRLIPDYHQEDWAIYALNRYRVFKKRLHIDLALRYDQHFLSSGTYGMRDSVDFMAATARNFDNTSFSIGFNHTVIRNLNVFANVATGFRAPNMAELTSNGIRIETQRYEIGHAAFDRETNIQGETGASYTHDQFQVQASAFHNTISNYIDVVRRGDSVKGYAVYGYMQTNAWLYGGEASLNLYPSYAKWLEVSSAYSMLYGYYSSNLPLPLMPANRFVSEVTLRKHVFQKLKNSFVRVGIVNVLAQDRPGPGEVVTPGYNLVNLSFGAEFMAFSYRCIFTAGVNNLLNEAYFDHQSRLRQYNVYNMGINAFITLRVPFSF